LFSAACGSAREIADLFEAKPEHPFEVTLLDQDAGAIAHAVSRIEKAASGPHQSVQGLVRPVRALVRGGLLANERFDVVYASGLYDYLPRSFAKELTLSFSRILDREGLLVIGNYGREVQTAERFFIEYAQDWHLIYRTRQDMLDLVSDTDLDAVEVTADDATGTILFLHARRAATTDDRVSDDLRRGAVICPR
jgi:extracellular factor (EF) 3-hydroxypalmitic acid methyl ester biosynthesis protein